MLFPENDNINIIENDLCFNDETLFEEISINIPSFEEEELKTLSVKRKKADFSKQTRLRKKVEIENIRKENQFFKQKIQFLEKKVNEHLCNECKRKILPLFNLSININNNNNSKNKLFFFTTILTMIFVYFCLVNKEQINIKTHLQKLK